jgi:hypothetical protein
VDKAVTLASYVPEDQKLESIAEMNLVLAPLVIESELAGHGGWSSCCAGHP